MNPDSVSNLRSLRSTVREIVIVVVSILIAFSLDAWWDSLKERREEDALLRALLPEFQANLTQLDRQISGSERFQADLAHLERLSSQSSWTESQIDTVPELLLPLYGWQSFNPITSTLDEALSTGSLRLIQNDVLRTHLAGWKGALWETLEQEEWLARMTFGYNRPFLNGRMALPHGEPELRRGAVDTALVPDLLRDMEFRNLLTYQMDLHFWAARDKKLLREELIRIKKWLEAEIGDAS